MTTATTASWFPRVTRELLARYDVPAPRYTSYPTAPEWGILGPGDYQDALARAARDANGPLSLYVHIPFCKEMCWYCGCNVVVTRRADKLDRYVDAVAAELALVAPHLGERRAVSRLHLGGGTPTTLDVAQLTRLWQAVIAHFRIAPGAELAVEIDPVVTTSEQLAALRGFGFNRLSMGVQDFDPDVQRAVGRVQSVELTRQRMDTARALGYASVNLDLIYGLPFQTPGTWERTLDEVVRLAPDRMAVFSFAYVPQVKPHQRKLAVHGMPTPATKLELLRLAHERFAAGGYRSIGMDHFALPEDDLSRAQGERRLWRDFQGYTTLRAADTVAFGVSGIGSVGGAYVQSVKALSEHAAMAHGGRLPVERGHVLSDDDLVRRDVITHLMCNFWVDLGAQGATRFAPELERLRGLAAEGLVVLDGTTVALTPLGRLFVRNVACVFDAYLQRESDRERPAFSRSV